MGEGSTQAPAGLRRDVPLAGVTTLELGGPARYFLEVDDVGGLTRALQWSGEQNIEVFVLGGGSNVVVADAGFPGLVLRMALQGIEVEEERGAGLVRLTAGAGVEWDRVVELAVAQDLAGVECMAGIPGTVGATPVQNVGAYGQEVADSIDHVRVFDRSSMAVRVLPASECGFGYRGSRFRQEPDRWVVLAVSFLLRPHAPACLRYPELARAVEQAGGDATDLAAVRSTVLELRRSKSMLVEEANPNRRSAGSFFVNPVLDRARLREVEERAAATGRTGSGVPSFPVAGGRFKVPAAWLIEAAGFEKGTRRGGVGISSAHALALVHHGGGNTAELIELAGSIRSAVLEVFGVELRPEPVFLGFANGDPLG